MFRIGEFAQFTRVSVKMLRHYDAIGLFSPDEVDQATGYRLYSADQLPRLNRIIALKDLGFGLDRIAELLDGDLTIDQIRGMLKARQVETEETLRSESQRLRAIEERLERIERGENATIHDVVVRSVPAMLIASIRGIVSDGGATALFEEVESYVAGFSGRAVAPPLMIEHATLEDTGSTEVEVAIPLQRPVPGTDRVQVRTLPAVPRMACVIYNGSYEGGRETRTTLLRWIEFNQFVIGGPPREVYLRFGADEEGYEIPDAYLASGPHEFVTELQIPVQKKEHV